VVAAQYYRNGSGVAKPASAVGGSISSVQPPECDVEEAQSLFGEPAETDPFAPFTSGTDYLLLQTSLRVVPEFSVSGFVFQNARDGTGIGVPVIQVKPLDWMEVSASAQIPYRFSEGGEFKPADHDLVLKQEVPLMGELEADFSGLAPDAVVSMWVRANF